MRKILITGANGQLGLACQQVFKDAELLLGDIDTLDITNKIQCRDVIDRFEPDTIIHAAAYTNVKGAEQYPHICYQVNVEGTYNLVEAARKHNPTFVYISTDFVFDGRSNVPYRETDAVNPLSVYGRSKLAGELIVQDLAAKHYILRTAWLYGEGKNFVRTMLAMADKQTELKVVNDQIGTPTYAKDLAHFIQVVLDKGQSGIYHATNEGQATWAEFATEILRLNGKKNRILPITSDDARILFADTARRPAYSVLTKEKLARLTSVRSWQEALEEYVIAGMK